MESVVGILALILGGSSLVLFFLTVGLFLNGWVLQYLWLWFVVPLFGFPPLSIPQAIGLAMIASFATYQTIDAEPKKAQDGSIFVAAFVRPFLTLAIGWVVQYFFL